MRNGGSQGRNAVNGRASTSSPGTTDPTFSLHCLRLLGSFSVRIGRNKRAQHYGVIFTCLNTRAVHLEMAVDLTTMEFVQVLRRFFSIHGYPAVLLSNNGSQMVGAARELREMIQGLDSDQLRDYPSGPPPEWMC